jgi:hypothetical protein
MQLNTKTVFTYSLLLVWLIICVILFVYVSRISYVPIVNITNWKTFAEMLARISPVRYTLDLLGALLGGILFSLACVSFGLGILRNWIQSRSSKLALAVTAFLIGEILFSIIFLTVISLYRLTPGFVAITISLGFLVGLPTLRVFIAHLPPASSLSTGFDMNEKVILGLVMTGLGLGLLLSSARLGYDAVAGYFSHPKIMAVSQLPVFFTPKDSFVVSSFHPGILFTVLIQLFGDQSARVLSWVNGVAILLMGLVLGQELGLTPRARLWFLTLMVTSTAFVDLLGDGKIELISTAPIIAAVYWIFRSVEQPTKGTFALIGVLAGFAIISRPYNIFLVSFFIALFIISQAFVQFRTGHFDLKHFMQSVLWMIPPLLALGTFHLIQNWIWLKDPLAPLAHATELSSSDWHRQLNPAYLTLYRLLYPLTLTFLNSPQSLGNISPLLIGFLPFLLVKRVRENLQFSTLLGRLSLVALLTLLTWITFSFTVLEIRYVLFLWMILFIAAAQLLESAIHHVEILIRPLLHLLLIIFLAIMCTRTLLIAVLTYFPLDNTGHSYCADSNLCTLLEALNQSAAPGDRVLVLHGYRYYMRPDLFACSSRVDEYSALETLARQNSPDFWVQVYRQGYKFIMFEPVLSERRYKFGKLPSLDTVPDWIDIKVLYSMPNANQYIYQLEISNPPIQPEISCEENLAGVWQLIPASTSQP